LHLNEASGFAIDEKRKLAPLILRVEKVFVTGGAGFIGSHLLRALLRDQTIGTVVVFDNFSSGQRSHIPVQPPSQLSTIEGDLKDIEAVKIGMTGCDQVFHLAANPDIAKAATQPSVDFWEGTYLTQNVLEAMRATGTNSIVYTSGSGVYGENARVAFSEDYGPCVPISTYGASKLASEALVAAYCHMFGIRGRAFRFANVVGPRQTHGVGYDFVSRLRRDPTRLRILGNGKQNKSYIHVDDVLTAMFKASADSANPFEIYNVATDDYITVDQIAEIAITEYGLDHSKVRYEYTGGDRGWKGDVPVVRFDVSKIKALGWRAKRTSIQAVRDAIQAMINDPSHP
jgi:UDP-glucose 4-epimerase